MGLLSPVLRGALRGRDPYPGDLLALDFAGVGTGGQQFYKRNGVIVPRFEMLPGAISTGGNNLGQALRNGSWSGNLPDGVPLIGDGGLGVPEAKTEIVGLSCRPADANWTVNGATKSSGPTYKGIFQSALVTSTGATFHRIQVPAGVSTVTSGQLYTIIVRFRTGTSDRIRVILLFNNVLPTSSCEGLVTNPAITTQDAGPLSIVENVDEGDGFRRLVLAWTPNATNNINGSGVGPGAAAAGLNIEVLGLSIQAGAYVNNPPIDNGNLPATRTAVAQRVGGLVLPSAFEVRGRFKLSALPPVVSRVFSLTASADATREHAVYVGTTGVVKLLNRDGTANAEFGTRVIAIGEVVDFVARFKANDYSLTINDNAAEVDTSGAMPAGVNQLGLGYRIVDAAGSLNGEIANLSIREVV